MTYRVIIDSPEPTIPWSALLAFALFAGFSIVVGLASRGDRPQAGLGFAMLFVVIPLIGWCSWSGANRKHESLTHGPVFVATGPAEHIFADPHNVDAPVSFYVAGRQFSAWNVKSFHAQISEGDCLRVIYNERREVLQLGVSDQETPCPVQLIQE